ncbi:MAG: hypothetical protein HYZ28_16790 [Myxococcales bacterium]|nr:hypothetical protein [Myxococcales bacterium]
MRRELAISSLSALVCSAVACVCGGPVSVPCNSNQDCAQGGQCVDGRCKSGGGGGAGGGFGGGAGGGAGGGGITYSGCDPSNPNNPLQDTDCDGITDADEYAFTYAGGKKTDPCVADTDADGLKDGVEIGRTSSVNATCGFVGDADTFSRTDPTSTDSDGDTLLDGAEDKNQDGKVDPGESNPLKKDSDCDGLSDPDEVSGAKGCATDPLKRDSDGDGLPDGLEVGLTAPGADSTCTYPPSIFDSDPSTKTNACGADSDGDGVMDGAEDNNQNGKLDPGELNPNDGADAQGPAQQACSTANLKPINFHSNGTADVQVALVPSFSEVSKLAEGATDKGLIFYDPANKIAGLVFSQPPAGANGTAEETAARSKLGSLGAISAPITQTFTTWDGFAQSARATYDYSGNADVKARINDIAKAFLGQNLSGLLQGAGGAVGPFKLQAEYVRRTANRAVVLFALTPMSAYTGAQVFRLDDVGGGSALAQFGDFAGSQCEVFTTQGSATVDFLWVVDNSCSMQSYQTAVGNAGTQFGQKLASAGLDWRVGAVTTAYYSTTYNQYRPFTKDVPTMQQWFTQYSSTWFGTSGTGTEKSLESASKYIPTLLPKTTDPTQNRIRTSADLHLILLGDADDQSAIAMTTLNPFFANYDGAGSKAVVHGIVCPQGQSCGETQRSPRRNLDAIATAGGVLGDINVAQSGSPQLANTIDAILSAAIAGTGHQLLKPPISATIKIAVEAGGTVGTCSASDVPRDRSNGFDFDSASRRVVFYGACRPSGPGKKVAVSYKFWNDGSPDPGGDPCGNKCAPPLVCNPSTGQCVCPTDCGGCAQGQMCDMVACTCGPGIG